MTSRSFAMLRMTSYAQDGKLAVNDAAVSDAAYSTGSPAAMPADSAQILFP